jgi:hypothetical protein
MQIKLRILQLFTILALSVCFNAYADSWNCSSSDLVREVVIDYPQGGSVPCNVIYKKQTEGFEDQVLWSADNLEGYCEDKARELVANLESWGWVCLETVSTGAEEVVEAEEATEAEVDVEVTTESEQAADTEQ